MRFNIGKAGIGGAFANRILRGIVRLVEVDFKADDTGQAPVLEVGRIDKVDALSYVKAVIYLVFVYPDGVERSRIGAVVDAGLCHVLLCSGKQFLFGSSHQPKFSYLPDIPAGQHISVTFFGKQHFIRQGSTVVLVTDNLPKLGVRIPCAVVVLLSQTKRVKGSTELHAVELAGFEPDFEFLSFKDVFLREVDA